MSRVELIAAALLIGTGYNSGVKGVGPKTAVKIVRDGKFAERITESENAADPEDLIRYFLDPPVEKNYTIAKRSPVQEKVFEILCEEHGFSEERVSAGLERLGAKKGQATLDAWF